MNGSGKYAGLAGFATGFRNAWPVILASVILATANAAAEESRADAVAGLFSSNGVTGTLVIANADGEVIQLYNKERAAKRFSPASTFKIPNTLIALDKAVVAGADSRFQWDGVTRDLPAWNQDQTLQSAFSVSCLWCYQEIARTVGLTAYATALARLHYGNQQVGDEVDQLWLNGDLRISALEQVQFVKSVLDYSVPYSREYVDVVKDIMLVERTNKYTLRAKSGWTGPGLAVGWYVGYLEAGDRHWLFAMNMQLDSAERAALRKDLVLQAFEALDII